MYINNVNTYETENLSGIDLWFPTAKFQVYMRDNIYSRTGEKFKRYVNEWPRAKFAELWEVYKKGILQKKLPPMNWADMFPDSSILVYMTEKTKYPNIQISYWLKTLDHLVKTGSIESDYKIGEMTTPVQAIGDFVEDSIDTLTKGAKKATTYMKWVLIIGGVAIVMYYTRPLLTILAKRTKKV